MEFLDEVSTLGSTVFTQLATVTLMTDAFTQQQITIIEESTGVLASGVDAIRFDYRYHFVSIVTSSM